MQLCCLQWEKAVFTTALQNPYIVHNFPCSVFVSGFWSWGEEDVVRVSCFRFVCEWVSKEISGNGKYRFCASYTIRFHCWTPRRSYPHFWSRNHNNWCCGKNVWTCLPTLFRGTCGVCTLNNILYVVQPLPLSHRVIKEICQRLWAIKIQRIDITIAAGRPS